MPRQGGLIKVLGAGVGMAAEYREHRKEKKLSRGNSQQDTTQPVAGPSNRPELATRGMSSASDLPPTHEDVASETGDRSLSSGGPVISDKKAALRQYDDEPDVGYDLSPDYAELEDDEAVWDLDEAADRERGGDSPPETPTEATSDVPTLIREVLDLNRTALASAPGFERSPLPCPVILPQRRPRKKTRGFVHAYAPLLGECNGISQETFLKFLNNFHKASQASPVFTYIQIAAGIAGFAPSVIAMAVTTAVQVAAGVGQEIQSRQRTNSFLDQMNEQLFQPAGLYAMVVKYKSEAEVKASGNSMLARLGVGSEKVDMSTHETIAKYLRTESGSSQQGMSERLKGIRLASSTTKGHFSLPQSASLIFPEIDKAVAIEGEETFKAKAKDAQGFLGDYFDRRAQMKYAAADPNSSLVLPNEQLGMRSKLADPSHPMYNGGLIGFVSGGALTQERGNRDRGMRDDRRLQQRSSGYESDSSSSSSDDDRRSSKYNRRSDKRERRDERRLEKYEQRLDSGRGLTSKKERRYDAVLDRRSGRDMRLGSGGLGGRGQGPLGMLVGAAMGAAGNRGAAGRSQEYENTYDQRQAALNERMGMRKSFDDRSAGYGRASQPAMYGEESAHAYGQPAPYGGQQEGMARNTSYDARQSQGGRRQQKQGGIIKKLMTEDVLYLMIVNLPSEAELAEARATLARAKSN